MNLLLKNAILVAFYFAPQILKGCGQIRILRVPSTGKSSDDFNERKITCVSEDDGGALVWNYNSDSSPPGKVKHEFKDISPSTSDSPIIDCALNNYNNCMDDWTTDDWIIVNSKEKAMGPVLDKRWEDFDDEEFTYVFDLLNLTTSDAVVFSIRAAGNAKLELCEAQSAACHETTLAFSTSPMEWRTFILKWSKENKIISLYNETQLLSEDGYKNQKWNSIKFKLAEGNQNLLRFHHYNYLHTTKKGAELIIPEWNATRGEVCIEMSVGLCSECQLNISVVDETNNTHPMEPIIPQNSSVGHGLPTWQFVRRTATLEDDFKKPFRLSMTTILHPNVQNPLWAVANVRECKSKVSSLKTLRQVSKETRQQLADYWPNISCQKLSYTRPSVVNASSTTINPLTNDPLPCKKGTVGPLCAINCKDVGPDNDCKGLSICYTEGCVCAQGFSGENCTTECNNNKYGFGCTRDCTQCVGGTCDRFTGDCPGKCTGGNNYVRPLCMFEIKKPTVNVLSATSAEIYLDVGQFDEQIVENIAFQIKDDEGHWGKVAYADIDYIPEKVSYRYFENLEPNSSYTVRGVLKQDQFSTNGSETHFHTECNDNLTPEHIEFEPLEHGRGILTWSHMCQTSLIFNIKITLIGTELRNMPPVNITQHKPYNAMKYQKRYSMNINTLLPSTEYRFCVSATKNNGEMGTYSQIEKDGWTKSDMMFNEQSVKAVEFTNSTIVIQLPSVIHDTQSSMMHVIVKGSRNCKSQVRLDPNLAKHVNLTDGQFAWKAASLCTRKYENRQFTIDDNIYYEGNLNCSLRDVTHPEIFIVVESNGPNVKQTIVTWTPIIINTTNNVASNASNASVWPGLIWLAVIPVVTIVALSLYFFVCK